MDHGVAHQHRHQPEPGDPREPRGPAAAVRRSRHAPRPPPTVSSRNPSRNATKRRPTAPPWPARSPGRPSRTAPGSPRRRGPAGVPAPAGRRDAAAQVADHAAGEHPAGDLATAKRPARRQRLRHQADGLGGHGHGEQQRGEGGRSGFMAASGTGGGGQPDARPGAGRARLPRGRPGVLPRTDAERAAGSLHCRHAMARLDGCGVRRPGGPPRRDAGRRRSGSAGRRRAGSRVVEALLPGGTLPLLPPRAPLPMLLVVLGSATGVMPAGSPSDSRGSPSCSRSSPSATAGPRRPRPSAARVAVSCWPATSPAARGRRRVRRPAGVGHPGCRVGFGRWMRHRSEEQRELRERTRRRRPSGSRPSRAWWPRSRPGSLGSSTTWWRTRWRSWCCRPRRAGG